MSLTLFRCGRSTRRDADQTQQRSEKQGFA